MYTFSNDKYDKFTIIAYSLNFFSNKAIYGSSFIGYKSCANIISAICAESSNAIIKVRYIHH